MTSPQFSIAGRPIGPGHPTYVIAEMSANHGQDFDQAVKIIHSMKECGADAVKLQTYTPDTITIPSDRPEFRIGKGTLWSGKTLHALYGEAYTPWEWQPKLKKVANDLGMHLFSTPFDFTAVDFLETIDVPAHKIASFEVVDLALIQKAASTGKPLIISTGMATLEEIEYAVDAARSAGCTQIALLKCTSAYPAPPTEMRLKTIPDLASRFGVVSGLSDHTLGISVPVAAVTLGASIVEKHFTLSRSEPGPDSAFSLEPKEFKEMIHAIRTVEAALGEPGYGATQSEMPSMVFRRSLFVVEDIGENETLTEMNIRSIRPGYGLTPRHLPDVLGKKSSRPLKRGQPLSWDDILR